MTPPTPPGPELLGPLLARLRLARGHSQQLLAAELCAASGVPTLSRHEVSRWERQLRVPGGFWLGWLAVVLAVPVELLAEAAAHSRRLGPPPGTVGPAGSRSRVALFGLAQRWLADPCGSLLVAAPTAGQFPAAPAAPPPAEATPAGPTPDGQPGTAAPPAVTPG
ncbi:helix-turn-helix domain-containing protein [Micromonospora rubida]|uniref:Helix-turn-helix domain-containing protein n=1 Tax=Micromonospora rubida TaxID=2697657 RepID=A0ABW7SS40_9ACTN